MGHIKFRVERLDFHFSISPSQCQGDFQETTGEIMRFRV